MGLFDKKYCDICGEKIGFLGNRKLEDGNLCKECAGKLSPFFRERRSSTVDEIREQLAYREENAKALETFHPDLVFGEDEKVYLDVENKKLIVTSASNFRDGNPDIVSAEQIIVCETNIEDDEEEIFYSDKDGNEKSYNPPRYRHAYEFHVTLKIDSPWFDEISVDLNNGKRPESADDDLYAECKMQMEDLAGWIRRWKHIPSVRDVNMGPIPGYFENLRRQQLAEGGSMGMPTPPRFAEPISTNGTWECSCGMINAGKFCEECGKPRR